MCDEEPDVTDADTDTTSGQRYQIALPESHLPTVGTPLMACPTNWDMSTPQGQIALFNAQGGADLKIEDLPNGVFEVVKWAILPARITNKETGEVSDYVRTVLWNRDGRTFATSGIVIPQRLRMLVELFSLSAFADGVKVRIIERKCKSDMGKYHDLLLSE